MVSPTLKIGVRSLAFALLLWLTAYVVAAQENTPMACAVNKWYVGAAVGPETGISGFLPKISYYQFARSGAWQHYRAAEASLWLMEAVFFSVDALAGIQWKAASLDVSLGWLYYPKLNSAQLPVSYGPYQQLTLNPKMGIQLGRVWLKAGPAFFLYRNYRPDENQVGLFSLTQIGKLHYNFELLIDFRTPEPSYTSLSGLYR